MCEAGNALHGLQLWNLWNDILEINEVLAAE